MTCKSIRFVAGRIRVFTLLKTLNRNVAVHTEDMEATPSKPEETSGEPSVQLEPSQNEMERERLQHQAETVSCCLAAAMIDSPMFVYFLFIANSFT